jgi:hypothetical protein
MVEEYIRFTLYCQYINCYLGLMKEQRKPRLRQLSTLLEQVAAAVAGPDLVADRASAHLGDLVREVRAIECYQPPRSGATLVSS